jgi:hypothetical protein
MGETVMRYLLASSLLIALGGTANAATVHHAHRHAVADPNRGLVMGPASGFAYAPPRGPRVQYAPAPYYDDQPDPRVDSPYKNWGG